MNVQCELCETVYRVDPEKVPVGGTQARCTVCSNVIALLSDETSVPVDGQGPATPTAETSAQVAAALGDAYIPVPSEEQELPFVAPGAPVPEALDFSDADQFTPPLEPEMGEPDGGRRSTPSELFDQFPLDPVEPATPLGSAVEPVDGGEPLLPEIKPRPDELRPVSELAAPIAESPHGKPFVDNDLQDLFLDPAEPVPPAAPVVPDVPPVASAPLASPAPPEPAEPQPVHDTTSSDSGQLTPPWDAMTAQLDSIMPTGDQSRPSEMPGEQLAPPPDPPAQPPVDVPMARPAPPLEREVIPTPPVRMPDPSPVAPAPSPPVAPRAPVLKPQAPQPVRDQRAGRLSRPFSAPVRGAPPVPDPQASARPTAPVFRPTPGTPVQEAPSPPTIPTPAPPKAPPAPPVVETPSIPTPIPAPPAQAAPAAPVAEPPRRPINPFLSKDPSQKARRLARALISDMIVYQPEKRQKAMRDGTLKEVFDHEIKKSWEEFVDQVGDEIANSTTHFNDALNEILAGGKQVF